MYCPQCSYNNPNGTPYCKNCERALNLQLPETALNTEQEALVYTGFWLRFFAALLDLFILGVVIIFVLSLAIGLTAYYGRDDLLQNSKHAWLSLGLIILMSKVHAIFMESGARSATLGKRWMNIKLLDNDGNRLTLGRATGRQLSRPFSFLPLILGFLIQPFTQRKQALHDVLAGTVVVRASDSNKISFMATLLVLFYMLMVPVLALLVTTGQPYYKQSVLKAQLKNGVQAGLRATQAVASFYLHNGRVPTRIDDVIPRLRLPPHIFGIVINQQNGEVSVTFSAFAGRALGNKHLLFTPTLHEGHTISWQCHSSDIEAKMLPVSCKQGLPG